MLEPITTTANRIKQSGYWCEDADTMTDKFLDIVGMTWDAEVPVIWGLDERSNLGISNALQALGCCRPKYKGRAKKILENYVWGLFKHFAKLTEENKMLLGVGPTVILDDARSMARSMHYAKLKEMKKIAPPKVQLVLNGLMILYSTEPLFIRAIHANKELLGAVWAIHGESAAAETHKELKNFLRQEIENG